MRQLDINPDNTSPWYLRKRPSKILKSRKFQARSTVNIVKSLPFGSKGAMYLWTLRCAANTAQLQARVLYPFSVPSLHSLPMQNLSRAFGSLICQQLAPGGSRSREMRSLETERCVWHAAAAALRQVLPSSRLCPLAGPSLEPGLRSGFLRQAVAPDWLPASCSSPPNELHSRPARASPEISRQFGGPAPQQAWLRVHTCRPGPPPSLPATPGTIPPPRPAWVQYHSPHGADSGRAATPPPPPPRPVAIYREASPEAAAEAAEQGQPRETFSELTQLRH